MHARYGEWSLSPTATPPQLTYRGHHYRLATTAAALDPRDVVVGHTAGGELYGPADRPSVPTVLQLRTGATVAEYALAGGP